MVCFTGLKFGIAGLLLVLYSAWTFAQSESAPVINWYGQAGLEHTESAKSLGFGRLVIGAHGDMSLDDGFCVMGWPDVRPDTPYVPLSNQYSLYPYFGIGLA
jgi:hypothetical protein